MQLELNTGAVIPYGYYEYMSGIICGYIRYAIGLHAYVYPRSAGLFIGVFDVRRFCPVILASVTDASLSPRDCRVLCTNCN